METVLEAIGGPLAAIECRRSLGRGWVLVVRALAALPSAAVLLAVVWYWWLRHLLTPTYSPNELLIGGIVAVEYLFVTTALLLGQALLAGSFAREGVKATLGLLLAAQVSSSEIVRARLAGRLILVGVVFAAGLPPLVWLAALGGLELDALTILIALPVAVAFGGGGLAVAVSALARRGRDALLVVYLLELLLLLAPLAGGGLPAGMRPWVEALNPFQGIVPLAGLQDPGPALLTIVLWTLLGAAGCIGAAWRLRPAFLADTAQPRRRWRLWPTSTLPAVGERPMIWKELYVAHVQPFSRAVKWLGVLVIGAFAGSSVLLAGLYSAGSWLQPETDWSWTRTGLTDLLAWSWLIAWLLQWAVGLRAAAAIASERQQGTWDALLASPLEAREIVLAKIYGSIYVLRGLLAAIGLAWVAGLLSGALSLEDFAILVGQTVAIGGFMLAFGTGCSLHCASPTRAMALTIGCWIAAGLVIATLAGIVTFLLMFAWLIWSLSQGGLAAGAGAGTWPTILYSSIRFGLYLLAAALAVVYIRSRFDALAGRCSAAGRDRRAKSKKATRTSETVPAQSSAASPFLDTRPVHPEP